MKNILVIGGTGFIGSHLAENLLHKGYKVYALARKQSNTAFLRSLGAEIRVGDLLDMDSLKAGLEGIDTVFCLVNVKPSGRTEEEYKKQLYCVHVEGTANLAGACKAKGVRRIVYLSSVSAMGYSNKISVYDESFAPAPVDDYGKAKLAAEKILGRYIADKTLDITILRPPGVFGERGLGPLGKIMFFAEKGIVPVIGSGKNKQSIAYVGNIVNEAVCAAENPASFGKTYIVSDRQPYTVNELIAAVSKAMNMRPLKAHIPVFAINCLAPLFSLLGMSRENIVAISTERVFDPAKIFSELGCAQEYDLSSAVSRVTEWYRKDKNAGS